MYDTHAHLTFPELGEIETTIQKSKDAGLKGIISCSTSLENLTENLAISRKFPRFIHPTVGIHPEGIPNSITNLKENFSPLVEQIVLYKNEIVAIGEIGLDYYHSLDNIEKQKEVFNYQLKLSIDFDLPVIIHTRNNKDQSVKSCILDTISILKGYTNCIGVCHCFTGNLEEAKQLLDLGFYLGFTNIVTYKSAVQVQEVAEFVSKNYPKQILFETDAPYLPPATNRGQICYPYDVKYVYEYFEKFIDKNVIAENVQTLFNLDKKI